MSNCCISHATFGPYICKGCVSLTQIIQETSGFFEEIRKTVSLVVTSGASRSREVNLLLWSTPVLPHLESCVQLWSPQHKMELLEQVQRRTTKMIWCLEHLSYEELGLLGLEKTRLCRHLIAAFQYLKGDYRKDGDNLFNTEWWF